MDNILTFKNITCVPSFHSRMQFAIEVRNTIKKIQPDIIAIELPDIYYSDLIVAVERLPKLSLLCLPQGKNVLSYIPVFPSDSLIEGIRIGREAKIPLAFIDLAIKNYDPFPKAFAVPDDYAIAKSSLLEFYKTVEPHLPKSKKGSPDRKREEHMAAYLLNLSKKFKSVVFIGGMSHWKSIVEIINKKEDKIHKHEIESNQSPYLAKLGKKAFHHLLGEIPYLVLHYELSRRFNLEFDRNQKLKQLIIQAKNVPNIQEEEFSIREVKNVWLYALKLTNTDHRISPDLYNLLLSAKLTMGDDYAIELLDLALSYPYKDNSDLPEIEFDPEKLAFILGGRVIKLKRRLPQLNYDLKTDKTWIDLEIKRKKVDEIPDNYYSKWLMFGFFSHIPEDLILEGFVDRLGDKLASELIQNEPKIEEFRGSIMDGIAIRETIRNWHQDKIFVKEEQHIDTDIGVWILIFDEDLNEWNYPWVMSLSAEHHNESDIAFYASNPSLHPVTKEIVRAKYGALMAIKPPLPSINKISWDELDVHEEYRKEQLIISGIKACPRKGILYLAAKPPDPYYFKLAEQYNKQLFFLPINRISKRHLKKIQTFHLLKNKESRKIADDYI